MKRLPISLTTLLIAALLFLLEQTSYGDVNTEREALAKRIKQTLAEQNPGQGRPWLHRIMHGPRAEWVHYFINGGPKPSWSNEAFVTKHFTTILNNFDRSKSWPMPAKCNVPKSTKAVSLDGTIDSQEWSEALTFRDAYDFNFLPPIQNNTTWYLKWDDTYLYVAFDCVDSDLIAKKRERDDQVYLDDCVEIFLRSDLESLQYWEIIVSPNGSLFDSMETKHLNKWRAKLDPAQNLKGLKYAFKANGTLNQSDDADHGYSVEMAIPFASLPGVNTKQPLTGTNLNFMLCRLDKSNHSFRPMAFKPLMDSGHNIWNHATMTLVGPKTP